MASVIMGNEYDNSLIGTEDAEKLNSGDGADIVDAGAGDDKVNAGDGDDTITGGTGDDYINGGDGFDTAVYNGIVQTYINKDGLLVITDGKGNAIEFDTGTIEGTDTLRNIDALQFNNYTYYLDGRNNAVFAIDDEAVTTESSILNNIEILANDIDLDGDTLSVTKIDTSDSIGNFTLNLNGTINYSPNSGFTYLAVGDTAEDTVTYTVTDGNGSIVTGILTVTITGINDAPIITEPVSAIGSENDAGFSVNLLDGASDVDHSDTLSITNLTLISGDDSGITITGMNLGVNPDAYDSLNDGEDSVITYSYNIIDGHGGSTSQTATITITGISDSGISGVTVDGYFQGATVFVDSNNNLILDASEESTFTDGEGGFALSSSGPLVMTGGVDVATGLEFEGMLRAPDGATSITALSTIVSELMDLGLTKFDAEKQLSNSLENIDTSIDVLSLDPVAASLMGTAGGQEVMATASQVLNTVIQIASLLEGAGAINMADNMAEIFTQIAIDLNSLNTGEIYELTSPETVESLIIDSSAALSLNGATIDAARVTETVSGAATVISDANLATQDVLVSSATGGDFLTEIAKIGIVTQGEISESLAVATESADPATAILTVEANYTATNLTAAITAAEGSVGAIEGYSFNGETDENTPITLDVLNNGAGTDLTGTHTIDSVIISRGSGIAEIIDNKVEWIPGTDYDYLAVGEIEIVELTYNLLDGSGTSLTSTLSITVVGSNDGPVAEDDFVVMGEGTSLLLNSNDALANDHDTDSDLLTLDAVLNPVNGTFGTNNVNAPIFIPDAGFSGLASFEYTISDGDGGISTATVYITVTPNTAPNAIDDIAVIDEDTSLILDATVALENDIDPDGDILAITGITNPIGGEFSTDALGNPIFTPTHDFSGLASFDYTISDGRGGEGTATVYITVNAVNDAPVANADTGSTDENVAITLDVLANDTDADLTDMHTVDSVSVSSGLGVASIVANQVVWTPGTDYDILAVGQTATVELAYTMSDSVGASSSSTVTITVIGSNDGPIAVDDVATTDEDTAITFAPGSGLVNDSDVDSGDTLVANNAFNAVNGSIAFGPIGEVIFTPDAGFSGLATFDYTIQDSQGAESTATVYITVNAVNDAPVAVDDGAVIDEDTVLIADPSAALVNDTDIDGDTLTATSAFNAVNGVLSFSVLGEVVFTPDADFNGLGSFDYTISDGNGGEDTATVFITVNPVNDAPIAVDDYEVIDEDTALIVDPSVGLANDSDVDGDTLTAINALNPVNGSLSFGPLGEVTFTPDADFSGLATFDYTISDGNGGEDTATVFITVTPVNDAPVAVDDYVTIYEGASHGLDPAFALRNDTDSDGDYLVTTNELSNFVNGTVVGSEFIPDAGFIGVASFDYTISDGRLNESTATIYVTVAPNTDANETPVAVDDNIDIFEGTAHRLDSEWALSNDYDTDSGYLTVVDVSNFVNGALSTNEHGQAIFVPDTGFIGLASFDYTISDGRGGESTATINITVNPNTTVNTAPVAIDDYVDIYEGSTYMLDTDFVLHNDHDDDGEDVTTTGVSNFVNGTLVGNDFVPDAGFIGVASFDYTVRDERGGENTATVYVTIHPNPNTAPVAVDDYAVMYENTSVTFAPGAGLVNDYDADGDLLTPTNAFNSVNGTIVITAIGEVIFTPDVNFVGEASFDYSISDGNGGEDTATVFITVNPANNSPVANPDNSSTNEDTAVTILAADLLSNDSDPDTGVLSLTSVSNAVNGLVSLDVNGDALFTPNADFSGQATFDYTIRDPQGSLSTSTVYVDVAAIADTPILMVFSQGEFLVNQTTDNDQTTPAIATLTGGDFVITWSSLGQDGSDYGIYARRYDTNGQTVSDEFLVNQTTDNKQFQPAITALADGGFVISWSSWVQDGSGSGIYALQYDADGQVNGNEFLINQTVVSSQAESAITALTDGGFVVTWKSLGETYDIYARSYDANGQAISGEFLVNQSTDNQQTLPAITALTDGGFVISWTSSNHISARHYDANGQSVGDELLVSQSLGSLSYSTVTSFSDGGFVVSWTDLGAGNHNIYAQLYDANDQVVGSEFLVNQTTDNFQTTSAISTLIDGGFVISWASSSQDASNYNIYARRYDANGQAAGDEFLVSKAPDNMEYQPAITALTDGGFVISWSSGEINGAKDIYTKLFDANGKPFVTGDEDQAIELQFSANLVDTDGSESLEVIISGIPDGAVLSAGTNNLDGSWIVQSTDISGLFITSPQDFYGTFDLTLTATATEISNGDVASISEVLSVKVNPVVDVITGTIGSDIITGVNGSDELFLGLDSSSDTVIFKGEYVGSGVDTVYQFDSSAVVDGGDILNINDILIDSDVDVSLIDTSSISDYVVLTESIGSTIVSVDADGALPNDNFQDIAVLNAVTGLNLETLLTNGNIDVT